MKDKWLGAVSYFNIDRSLVRLLIVIFIAGVLARGGVIFNGQAIDDFDLLESTSAAPLNLGIYFSQGRYILGSAVWFVDSMGVKLSDLYFSLGIVSIFLQSVFLVSVLRFVGFEHSPAASLIGALMIAHPYLTEVFTFRIALPGYSLAVLFTIVSLELITRRGSIFSRCVFSMLAILGMLFTYQVMLNYLAVAIIFAFVNGRLAFIYNKSLISAGNFFHERAVILTIASIAATFLYFLITSLVAMLTLRHETSRAKLISLNSISLRIDQVLDSLQHIYWVGEPVFNGWLKPFILVLLVFSFAIIVSRLFVAKFDYRSVGSSLLVVFTLVLLVPVSIGVVIPFQDWWPVPRVLAHVTVIIGLVFLVADQCTSKLISPFVKPFVLVARWIVLVGFVFMSNQILADQQRINQWDRMMANRIISRLELYPNFSDVHLVYVNGGSWGFPARLRSVQGDLNASAFYADYSKVNLLSEVSGYWLQRAVGAKAVVGETYCEGKKPWPHVDSITIDNDLAIVCLKK